MIRNYLKVALRNLVKNRLISFINIFGLGLAMTVAMMVMIRLQDQLNFDQFHPYPNSTYRILSDYRKKNGEHWKMASTPLPLNNKLKELNGIASFVTVYPALNGKAVANGKEIYINGAFTDASFFNVFGFSLEQGNAATALQPVNGIILSRKTAERFFGNVNALGRLVSFAPGRSFVVTGVMKQPPGKSHIDYDAFAPMSAAVQMEKDKIIDAKSSDWYAFNAAYTYVVLNKGVSKTTFQKELKSISSDLNKNNKDGTTYFSLQSILKITPGSDALSNDRSNSSWSKFYFEIGVAFIILLAACFNYTNLTIARALTRAKEVGVRKINGAKRSQIFLQYIVESEVITITALGFAWLLLSFIIRYAPFNDDYEFIPSSFHYNRSIVIWSIIFAVGTGLLAGSAPAWILSAFTPLRVLKNLKTARLVGKISIQKALIVFQYSLSLTIIIFLLAFYRQFAHLASVDPGFKRDNVFLVPLHGLDEGLVSQKIAMIPGVNGISAMSGSFAKRFDGLNSQVWMDNKQNARSLNYYYADAAFADNLRLVFVAGRNFSNMESDSEQYVVLNEQAVHALGIKDNKQAIGQKIWTSDTSKLEIVGVVHDFKYENAGSPIRPLAIRTKKNAYNYLYVNADKFDKAQLASQIQAVMNTFTPSQGFDGIWLDEELAKGNSQVATISLLGYLAFIAITIASLGLLGLVVYTVEVRRKEISIRKVVGAGSAQLVKLLSNAFVKLIFIAGIIAMPIGYVAGNFFLQNFADRIKFGPIAVLPAFLILLVIGLCVIISQTYRAAVENPMNSLRAD